MPARALAVAAYEVEDTEAALARLGGISRSTLWKHYGDLREYATAGGRIVWPILKLEERRRDLTRARKRAAKRAATRAA